jgi:CO/xanthine dehydrogenase Mo-binding subunit
VTAVPPREEAIIGARLRRSEDPRLLRGRGSYVDDLRRPGLLQLAFVRSDLPHAALLGVETAGAQAMPGVVGVFTSAELAEVVRGPRATSASPGYQSCQTPVLAVDRVRYVGEPVAAVAALTRHLAEDGADAVRISYEPLRPLVCGLRDRERVSEPAGRAAAPRGAGHDGGVGSGRLVADGVGLTSGTAHDAYGPGGVHRYARERDPGDLSRRRRRVRCEADRLRRGSGRDRRCASDRRAIGARIC